MHSTIALAALSVLALVSAQVPGATTIEGSPTYDGLPVPGTTGKLGNAAITQNNPTCITYNATLPSTGSIHGYVSATANTNGTGVFFNVYLSGLPSESLGPFLYHIHDQPVPADGNCTATEAHLDPYIRGEIPPCDNTQPETCQVGDLTGKHGNVTISPFAAQYSDLYVSTQAGLGSFLGNRSINIHSANTTRLACANFELVSSNCNSSTSGSNVTTSTTATPTPFLGGATTTFVSIGAVGAGFVAFLL
ncbi:MAG: hypothetical protein ASARMPREDX12_003087 [Alectoria sarmentosa]|nr:MAG: hypothetical protein ASARMPREDX12_003087 [Alectoria sarmentosa]CAD6591883.1 MAG: hypothetical protein ASARMPRED_005797 [Alectoria sarmentosa]